MFLNSPNTRGIRRNIRQYTLGSFRHSLRHKNPNIRQCSWYILRGTPSINNCSIPVLQDNSLPLFPPPFIALRFK